MRGIGLFLCADLLVLAACHSEPTEPPPPPAKLELVVAPPGALGAGAAGTDAAPPLLSDLEVPAPDDPEDEPDAGEPAPDTDAGEPAPDTDGGVAL